MAGARRARRAHLPGQELKTLWQEYLAAQEAGEDLSDITTIHCSVEPHNWVSFEITTRGMACGPVWSQEWTLLKLKSPDETEES